MNERRPCQREGCSSFAEYAPKIFIPPSGGPYEEDCSFSIIVGLNVCAKHRAGLKQPDFLRELISDELRTASQSIVAARGKVPLDFDRAWVRTIRCDSIEYREFELTQAAGKTRQ